MQAHDLIDLAAERRAGLRCAHGHRDDEAARPVLLHGADGGPHGRSGREPVVHEDDHAARDAGRWPLTPQVGFAAQRLRPLPRARGLDVGLRDVEGGKDIFVEKAPTVRRDRTDTELGGNGRGQLASDDHVQLGIEPPCHLSRDDDSTAWQAQDEGVVATVAFESLGQRITGVAPVAKQDHATGTWAAGADAPR